jgi:rSAM/selenodomain-associated transferase 1
VIRHEDHGAPEAAQPQPTRGDGLLLNTKHPKLTEPTNSAGGSCGLAARPASPSLRRVSARRIIVFLNAPRPGLVKARIAEALDAEAAAAIYRVLLERTLAAVAGSQDVELRFAPEDALPDVAPFQRPGWSARPQGPGDPGERTARALEEAFSAGATRALALGTDCPGIEPEDVRAASAALEEQDLALGPALNGGCWLIGCRALRDGLIRGLIPGSGVAWEETLKRARAENLSVKLLRRLRNVDTLDDWRLWQREGEGGHVAGPGRDSWKGASSAVGWG